MAGCPNKRMSALLSGVRTASVLFRSAPTRITAEAVRQKIYKLLLGVSFPTTQHLNRSVAVNLLASGSITLRMENSGENDGSTKAPCFFLSPTTRPLAIEP